MLVNRLSKQPFARALIYTVVFSSLTACGGGGGSGGGSNVIPADNSPTVIYSDTNPLVPVTYSAFPASTISGTLEQQTVTKATSAWADGYKGQGITIGIVDSGVNPNHVDFYDDSGNSRVNWQDARGIEYLAATDEILYTNDYLDIDDPDYHGTHVSSIALGREYGVAPEATLLPVNVFFDNTSAYNIAVHEAVDYLASKTPIVNASISKMVNLSTMGGTSSEYNAYFTTLQNNDTVLIIAAGNGGDDQIGDPIGAEHFTNYNDAQNLAIESSISDQILYAIALDSGGKIASFSNYPGSCSDVGVGADLACDNAVMANIQSNFISVPGVSIEAAYGGDDTSTAIYSGTSMATPIVSGGVALLLSSWNQLTPQQAVSILKDTANDTGVYSDQATYGVGLMDIEAALTPVGNLKSSSSTSTMASYSAGGSSASIPASLSGLANLSGLKQVAYFDDYNRDFLIDLTPAIQIEQSPLDWNRFWKQSHSYPTNQVSLGNYELSMSFTKQIINHSTTSELQQLVIENPKSRFEFKQHSPVDLMQIQLNALMSEFYSNNQNDFGHTLAMQQKIGTNFILFSAVQEQDNGFNRVINNKNKILTQVQTVGLHYQANPNWSFALSSQLRQEQDGLMGLQGSGTFSFGEKNRSQINTASVQYSHNNIHLFSQLQQGQLLNSQHASGSYIQVKKAQMGQLKFGVMQQTSKQSAWGLQAYNENTLLNSTFQLTLPTGMSASGEIENQTFNYQHQNSLNPDTLELFYKHGLSDNLQYQFNAINAPQDSGFGLKINRIF